MTHSSSASDDNLTASSTAALRACPKCSKLQEASNAYCNDCRVVLAAAIRLEVCNAQTVAAGQDDLVAVRLTNVSFGSLRVELAAIGTRGVELHGQRDFVWELAQRQQSPELTLDVGMFDRARGRLRLVVTLHDSANNTSGFWEGEVTIGGHVAGAGQPLNIHGGDVGATSDNAVVYHPTNITVNYGANAVAHPAAAQWQVVELHPHQGRQHFAKADLNPERRRQKLLLTVMSDRGNRDICLLAGDSFRLGREYHLNDLALVVPQSADPTLSQSFISREHARIEFTPDGPKWFDSSSYGTLFREIEFSKESKPSAFLLADGRAISLPAREKRDRSHQALRLMNLTPKLLRGSGYLPQSYRRAVEQQLGSELPDPVGSHSAIRLRRDDELSGVEEYVLMQQVAEIGRDPSSCAVVLDSTLVAQIHARLLHMGGYFWIEPHGFQSRVEAHHSPVLPDAPQLLYPGLTLRVGDVEIVVREFSQHAVNCDCHERPASKV